MPKNLQKVHIWRYWSVSAKQAGTTLAIQSKPITDEGEIAVVKKEIVVGRTIDELLYDEGQKKMRGFRTFLDLLVQTSI